MPEYRIYTVSHLKQFIGVRSIECPDDDTAISEAQRMLEGHSLEVWQLDRFVVHLSPGLESELGSTE